MNRRNFLSMVASGLGLAAIDPEKLLWQPGAKTIFIPPLGNAPCRIVPWADVVRESLRLLENNLKLVNFHTSLYDPSYVGETIRIVKPSRYA